MFAFLSPALPQTDPKGSLPSSIVNQVNQAQPKSVIIAKQLLEKKKAANSLLRSPTATVSYQGVFFCCTDASFSSVGGLVNSAALKCQLLYVADFVNMCIFLSDFLGVVTANISGTVAAAGGSAPASSGSSASSSSAASSSTPASSGLSSLFPTASSSSSSASSSGSSAAAAIAKSEAAAAVSNRLHDIKGHEYVLFVFLVPVVLYYTIGG